LSEKYDRLADRLKQQSPDRQEAFWRQLDAMGKRGNKRAATISEQLRQAIDASGLTYYALAKRAGIKPSVITRFMANGTLQLTTVDRIATALGLALAPVDAGS
jgi:ribosome-binding protein aMBF1 (putative translation factor)